VRSIRLHNELIKTIKIHGGPYQERDISDHLWCYGGKFVAIELKVWPNKPYGGQLDFIVDIITVNGYGAVITFIKPNELENVGHSRIYKLGEPDEEYRILQNIMVDKIKRYYYMYY